MHALLNVADREGGIGSQVRVIAQAQSSSSATTSEAIAKVEKKDKLSVFLFGNDYSSLNKIRNEVKATQRRISEIETLIASTTVSASSKVELEAQLSVLKAEQVTLENYVTAHENEFSVFGWFMKVFAK